MSDDVFYLYGNARSAPALKVTLRTLTGLRLLISAAALLRDPFHARICACSKLFDADKLGRPLNTGRRKHAANAIASIARFPTGS